MARTKDEVTREVTQNYLGQIDLQNIPAPADIQGDILDNLKLEFDLENAIKAKGEKWKIPDSLLPVQIAEIMLAVHNIRSVVTNTKSMDSSVDIIAIYCEDGENEGVYVSSDEAIRGIARQYKYTLTNKEYLEILTVLKESAPRVKRCMEPNLIAVNNGIFDYDTKTLLPFSPDYVFLSKSRVNYNPNAKCITIYNPDDGTYWNIEDWMRELHNDPEVVHTLWEVLGAIVRPNVSWDCSAWFYSNTGNNGKGTLCELMRQLVGTGSYASVSLSDMGKDFMLEPLIHAQAIIVDENDVGTYIDKAANLKAIITGDGLQINRKFKTPITFQFKGFMVQCLNEMPRVKDKSDSFYRRQLFIPFDKCFTGEERKYIKHDYLHRPEVLEYVLYKVLHMDFNKISIPATCKAALEEYKEYNDPVRQFANEMFSQLVWDLVPFGFLYDLYSAWYRKNHGGKVELMSQMSFTQNILNLLHEYPEWYCKGRRTQCRPGNKMDKPEPLIEEYNLTDWMNPMYIASKDVDKKCCPVLKDAYRGIVRA